MQSTTREPTQTKERGDLSTAQVASSSISALVAMFVYVGMYVCVVVFRKEESKKQKVRVDFEFFLHAFEPRLFSGRKPTIENALVL